jgi:hypothetical protein
MLSQIFTYAVGLNSEEYDRIRRLRDLMQGNAQPGKHRADADHIFEAGKYGGYFITHDGRALSRRKEIESVVGPHFRVVTLADFLSVYDGFRPKAVREVIHAIDV